MLNVWVVANKCCLRFLNTSFPLSFSKFVVKTCEEFGSREISGLLLMMCIFNIETEIASFFQKNPTFVCGY